MISSWFSFHKLCMVINNQLSGMAFSDCYSFTKNELIIQNADESNPSLIINLNSPLPYIFIQIFHKPSKRVPIFPDFKNLTLIKCEIAPADRDLRLYFTNEISLIIRIRPPANNVYFVSDNDITSFKKNKSVIPIFNFDATSFASLDEDPRFNSSWKKRVNILFPDKSYPQILQNIEKSNGQVIGGKFVFLPEHSGEFDPDTFYYRYREYIVSYLKERHFIPEKTRLLTLLSSHSQKRFRSVQKLTTSEEQKYKIKKYRYFGDVLMAGLLTITPGQTEYEIPVSLQLDDFPKKIALKPDLKPQANAQTWYEKARRIERLQSDYEEKKQMMDSEYKLSLIKFHKLEQIHDLKVLQGWKKENKEFIDTLQQQSPAGQSNPERIPYREFTYKTWHIWVGKSAKDNDEMTFHHAHKNDLWLHTRHSTGSHVIIRRDGKTHIPKEIIEYAAALAARYSEEKHASLVPVVCTEKKHVIKRKGLPPGKVLFTMEKSILIKPLDI